MLNKNSSQGPSPAYKGIIKQYTKKTKQKKKPINIVFGVTELDGTNHPVGWLAELSCARTGQALVWPAARQCGCQCYALFLLIHPLKTKAITDDIRSHVT